MFKGYYKNYNRIKINFINRDTNKYIYLYYKPQFVCHKTTITNQKLQKMLFICFRAINLLNSCLGLTLISKIN